MQALKRRTAPAVHTETIKVTPLLRRLGKSPRPQLVPVVEDALERFRVFYADGPCQFPPLDSFILRVGVLDELAEGSGDMRLAIVTFPNDFRTPPNEALHGHTNAIDFFAWYLRRRGFLFASRNPERQWVEAKIAGDGRPLWTHYRDASEALDCPAESWISTDGSATASFRRVHERVYASLALSPIDALKGQRTTAFVAAKRTIGLADPMFVAGDQSVSQGPDLSFARLMQQRVTLCSPMDYCALVGAYSEARVPRGYFAYGEPEWLDAITPTGALVAYADLDGLGLYETPYDAWSKCNRARYCVR